MGFLKKHFGGQSSKDQGQASSSGQGSSGPSNSYEQSPSYGDKKEKEKYEAPPGPPPSGRPNYVDSEQYAPPPGPPPGQRGLNSKGEEYAPPPGPPPGHQASRSQQEEYAPPPGPPPGRQASSSKEEEEGEGYAPPPGPPPGYKDEEPPNYHDWQSAVPDTSLLPPPPAAVNNFSPTSNASNQEARRAWDWCKQHPLRPAVPPERRFVEPYLFGDISLKWPGVPFPDSVARLRTGVWSGNTRPGASDQCCLTNVPLYFALSEDSPKMSERMKTAYFEVEFTFAGPNDREGNMPSLAIGYAAYPYPVWRMPGWERGSLAVHSDDGRRYVNNQDGGLEFVEPFKLGETVGLGIRYRVAPGGEADGLRGEVFFTRNGRLEGTWSLQEEMDKDTGEYGNWGVAGHHDLFGAIGTFGQVGFKAVFKPEAWAFNPEALPAPGQVDR